MVVWPKKIGFSKFSLKIFLLTILLDKKFFPIKKDKFTFVVGRLAPLKHECTPQKRFIRVFLENVAIFEEEEKEKSLLKKLSAPNFWWNQFLE